MNHNTKRIASVGLAQARPNDSYTVADTRADITLKTYGW